ncbi:MAG: hypothetical protein ACE37H_15180 [Phycisphaeraceae bacterium]
MRWTTSLASDGGSSTGCACAPIERPQTSNAKPRHGAATDRGDKRAAIVNKNRVGLKTGSTLRLPAVGLRGLTPRRYR